MTISERARRETSFIKPSRDNHSTGVKNFGGRMFLGALRKQENRFAGIFGAPKAWTPVAIVAPLAPKPPRVKGPIPIPHPTLCMTCGQWFPTRRAWGKHYHDDCCSEGAD